MRKTTHSIVNNFNYLWRRYTNFINKRTLSKKTDRSRNEVWKDRFFTQIIKFAVPTGIVSLLASVTIEYQNENYLTAIIDLAAFGLVLYLIFHQRISIQSKKYFGVLIMIIFSILKIFTLQSLMLGSIFLLLLSLFVTLLFNKKIAYLFVVVNAIICISATMALMQNSPTFQSNLVNDSHPHRWMLYTFNFIFANLVIVSVVLYITNGFQKTIEKLANLHLKLYREVEEKTAKEALLQESITHYKSLFFFNPLPILIYDPKTLRLLYVNKSAIDCYGYTKREFLEMKVHQLLRCKEEAFRNKIRRDFVHQTDQHYRKSGESIAVDINASNIRLNGSWVRLAIIRDITAEQEYIAAIENKNEKMREIAYLQSHVIRNPLSRILGIVKLLNHEPIDDPELNQFLSYLTHSAEELDTVIGNIVKQTEEEIKNFPIVRRASTA